MNPKFKIGDKVKVLKSRYSDLVGQIAIVKSIDISGWWPDQPSYLLEGLSRFSEGYAMREELLELHEQLHQQFQKNKPKKSWNISAGKSNFCVGCNTFNEYQEQAYVCYSCENGL